MVHEHKLCWLEVEGGGGGGGKTMPCWEVTCRVLPSGCDTKGEAVIGLTAPTSKGMGKGSLEKSTCHTKSCTFPLTLWMGSTTTATALSESASKLWYKKIQNVRQNYKVTYNKFIFIHLSIWKSATRRRPMRKSRELGIDDDDHYHHHLFALV